MDKEQRVVVEYETKLENILHEFAREYYAKDVFFNDLPPLQRKALKKRYAEILKQSFNSLLDELLSEVDKIPTICGKCEKPGVNPFGECKCSYELSKFIKKQDVRAIINHKKQ